MAVHLSVPYVAGVVATSGIVAAGSAVVFDLNALVISGGAVLVAVIGIIAPLYFKLIADGRASKLALAQLAAAALAAAEAAKAVAVEQSAKMKEMNEKVDGKMDKQMALGERAARAEGKLEGIAEALPPVAAAADPASQLSTKDEKQLIQDAGIIKAVDAANTDIVKAVKEGPKT